MTRNIPDGYSAKFGRLLRNIGSGGRVRIGNQLKNFRATIHAVRLDFRASRSRERLRGTEMRNIPSRSDGFDGTLFRIFVQDCGDLRESVLNGVGDHIAQFRLNDFNLGEIFRHVDQLIVTDCARCHAVKAIEHDDVAFAANVGHEL